jgi:type II secretory pathway pseudopilin PulG
MICDHLVSLSCITARVNTPSALSTRQQPFRAITAVRGRGFTVIEILVVLTVLISLISLGSRYIQRNLDSALNQAMAYHFKRIDKAANSYVKDHYADLLGQQSELELESLVNAAYLPPDFLKTNNYQQSYKIRIFPKQQGNIALLQVVITTQKGQEISEQALRQISNLVGGQAGYVSILSPDKITGTQGGWEMESKDLSITTGHLASVTWVNQRDIIDADGFLRRQKFEGHPEYNRMETDLQMQDHTIEYENGEFKGKLSSNQLWFSNDKQSIEASLVQGPNIQLKKGQRKVELNSNQLSLGDLTLFGTGNFWMMPSKVDVNWNKVPFYELELESTEAIWKFVDQRCEKSGYFDFPQGRLFLVGRFSNQENAGLFICSTPSAENDGYGKEDMYSFSQGEELKARAYLIAKVGREYDKRIIKESDNPENLISFTMPKKITNLLFYSGFLDGIITGDLEADPLGKEYSDQMKPIVNGANSFADLYNSGQLPAVAYKFYKQLETLESPLLKTKEELVEIISGYNSFMKPYGMDFCVVPHFKKIASGEPW